MPLFDLNKIGGTNYNVQNQDTGDIITVKVIRAELLFEVIKAHTYQAEILSEATGAEVSLLHLFEGYIDDPLDITWYSTLANKLPAAEEAAVKQACKEGNRLVVLEVVTPNRNEGYKRGTKQG